MTMTTIVEIMHPWHRDVNKLVLARKWGVALMHCIVTRQIVIVKFTGYKTGVAHVYRIGRTVTIHGHFLN